MHVINAIHVPNRERPYALVALFMKPIDINQSNLNINKIDLKHNMLVYYVFSFVYKIMGHQCADHGCRVKTGKFFVHCKYHRCTKLFCYCYKNIHVKTCEEHHICHTKWCRNRAFYPHGDYCKYHTCVEHGCYVRAEPKKTLCTSCICTKSK